MDVKRRSCMNDAARLILAATLGWGQVLAAAPSSDPPRLQLGANTVQTTTPEIRADAALVVDESGRVLYAKHTHTLKPIASITKLMTAIVVLDSGLPLDEPITVIEADRDTMRNSRSRLRIDRGATLSRRNMLAVALMSSDNRAASALGRTAFPGGKPTFVTAMNRKAAALGMGETRFADPTGLDGGNQSTAEDLLALVRTAARYPLIRAVTSRERMTVWPYGNTGDPSAGLEYRNTNPLVGNPEWGVELSKTGYINEAGRCLVMRAVAAGRRLDIVLLDSAGKRTPAGDSNRLRKWLADSGQLAGDASRAPADPWTTPYWE